MSRRIGGGISALAIFATAITTVTLLTAAPASAASFSFTIATGGSTGTVYVDALYGGCTGTSPAGGYDAGWGWDTGGGLTNWPPFSQPATNVPTNGGGCGSAALSVLRLELFPSLGTYDPWSGSFGGANSQREFPKDGANWKDFGVVPVPTVGDAFGGFRITGAIMTSVPGTIPDGRLKVDVFQVPCGYPDVCTQPPLTNTGAYVGGFATGLSKANQWTGSVGWPGRYQVYVEDTLTTRKVHGFVDISAGNVPTFDLDAPCFGILVCVYDFGGLSTPTGGFHPLPPTRILDTRPSFKIGIDNGAISRGDGRHSSLDPVTRRNETKNHELKVTGVGGIPAYGVAAVLLNVTAVQPPGGDWLTVYPRPPVPTGGDINYDQATYNAFPNTSNLNLNIGETVPNLVMARVGAGGTIRFWNASVSGMHVLADVAGWFDTGAPEVTGGGLRFTGITPDRLLDTRNGIGDTIGHVMPGDIREVKVRDIPGVPSTAESVVLNVTAAAPTGTGFVTVYPSGGAIPNASNLNLNTGQSRANLVVVKVGTGNSVSLAAFETDLDLIVDIFGFYGPTGGLTTAIDPIRIVDSRLGLGTAGRFQPGESRDVQVTGIFGIPSNATAVIVNVTAAETTEWGFLTVWPAGLTRPDSSNVNWPAAGRNVPNMVMIKVGPGGMISVYNALGLASVIVDIFGYVTP
ncbi:MAG: hypothetical protein HY826_02810 [Actinobacteria bacterium]|nr:hypothetical protein [Actinomycetota bacterium]